jgi:hypothetical protein
VVDDGSGDPRTVETSTPWTCRGSGPSASPTAGYQAARNAGIAAARGRFVVPLDADDELAPDFLQVLLAAIEPHPDAAYAHCWAELFGDQSAIWVTRPFNDYQMLLSNSVVGCVLLRREAVDDVGGYAEDMVRGNEDWDLWLRLLAAGWGQVEVRRALFRYRKHGISMSVETEARYEEARAAMPGRHPSLYAAGPLRRRKREHYPWVTVLLLGDAQSSLLDQTIDDLEIVPLAPCPPSITAAAEGRGWVVRPPVADVFDAVRTARGKLVVDWSGVTAADPDALLALARALEDPRDAMGAVPNGWPAGDLLAWRRWVLVDRDGPGDPPLAIDVAVHAGVRDRSLYPGMCPLPGWDVRDELAGAELPVARQSPEEDGPVPAWVLGGR